MEGAFAAATALVRVTWISLKYAIRSIKFILQFSAGALLFGLVGGWAVAFLLNWIGGWAGGYSEAFPGTFPPSRLWPVIAASALVPVFFLRQAIAGRGTSIQGLEFLLMVGTGVFLFYLWLHDAYALLWPSLCYSLLVPLSVVFDLATTGDTGPVPATSGYRVEANKPGNEALDGANGKTCQFPALKPRHTFSDVDGLETVKSELLAFGREVLAIEAPSGKTGETGPAQRLRNGALLSGEPGNGKTFITEALAGSLGLPMITVTIGRLQSMWVGQTTERVVQAFRDAEAQAPCLLFLDEIDAILVNRDKAGSPDSENGRTVAAILTEAVNIRGKGIVLVAATNYPDRLDAAGSRDGRFDLKLAIPGPDYAARLGLLRRALPAYARVTGGSLEMAARHFEGFSTSRLLAIGREARSRVERGDNEISFTALLACLRKVQGVDPSGVRESAPGLDDLTLKSSAREQIDRLVSMMNDIEGTERMGGAIQPGAAFYGPPGTGKTATARAIAKATGWTFIPTTGRDLVSSEDAMRKVVNRAKDMRPAIVFIDEADDILADRNYSPHTKLETNKLLSLMDGADGRIPDVLFIATTNNPQLFDSASNRRLPIKIEFELPGQAEIRTYVQKWMRGVTFPFEPGFTLDYAVKMLEGQSIADIKVALQEAINIAISHRSEDPKRGVRPGDLARAVRSLSFVAQTMRVSPRI